jgi:nucleotide-binding universal stress UspA family protein
MREREAEFVLHRILVALDASTHSLAAMATAVELAAAMEAQLEGLFVEDVNLLRLAGLPFVREVRHTASLEALDSPRMERALKAQATQAREALAAAAGRAQVHWSFRVVRGHVTQELLQAASQVDLVTLGKQGRSRSPRARLGSTALRVALQAPGALLLVEHGVPGGQPVLVLYDGSEGAQPALDAAARLAKMSGTHLIVFLLAGAPDAVEQLEKEAGLRIELQRVSARFHALHEADAQSLLRVFQSEGSGLVVLGARSTVLSEETIQKLLDFLRNPVLLVR